jgi:hypothetical protein
MNANIYACPLCGGGLRIKMLDNLISVDCRQALGFGCCTAVTATGNMDAPVRNVLEDFQLLNAPLPLPAAKIVPPTAFERWLETPPAISLMSGALIRFNGDEDMMESVLKTAFDAGQAASRPPTPEPRTGPEPRISPPKFRTGEYVRLNPCVSMKITEVLPDTNGSHMYRLDNGSLWSERLLS